MNEWNYRGMSKGPLLHSNKIAELATTRYKQFAEAYQLEVVINKNLEVLGYEE